MVVFYLYITEPFRRTLRYLLISKEGAAMLDEHEGLFKGCTNPKKLILVFFALSMGIGIIYEKICHI